MTKYWLTPGGQIYTLYRNMAEQSHLLIAGETGSGKSVLTNGIIYTLLHNSPAKTELILIDPKRTELIDYADLPHTIYYACNPADRIRALQTAVNIMETRLQYMQQHRLKTYTGGHIYVVIDELADLLLTQRTQAKPLLQRLLALGRCTLIHCIGCSQVVNTSVISTELKVNFTAIVGLKTASKHHSRLIVDRPGCELFPDPQAEHKAYCYYKRGYLCELYNIPMIPQTDIDTICTYWTGPQCMRVC